MVPSAFIQVDALPISPSGKVDRQALPISDFCERQGENLSLPRTSLEKVIAQVWAEVLRLDKVGVEDNFFELGGHSLLATQVISRLRPLLTADLPLRIMFEPPSTVAELARAVVIHDLEQMSIEEAEGLIDQVEHLDKDALSRELALS
jgi:hypothetical protein